MTDSRKAARPRDPNQLAKLIADLATGDGDERLVTEDGKDIAAMILGRRGGLIGGHARAASLSPDKRSDIARRAAIQRWSKNERGSG